MMDNAVRCRRPLDRSGAAGLLVALILLAIPSSAAAATLELSASDATIGGTIEATATLAGGVDATGTISFEVFAPNDVSCATPLSPAPSGATVNGDDSYPSGPFTPESAGEYRWSAKYSGDDNNDEVELDCTASSTVAQASPALTGTASASVLVGTAINDSVTFSGGFDPGGQLTFRAFGPGNPTCSGTAAYEEAVAVTGNDTYEPAGFTPPAGTYLWTVTYSGDENNAATAITCGAANQTSTVNKATTALVGTATAAVQVGTAINDSATLSGGLEPGGQLLFRAFGPGDPTCANAPAYEEAVAVAGNGTYAPAGFTAAAGLYLWTVTYEGDEENAAAELPCGSANQSSAVGTLNVTLAASTVGSVVGSPTTATATLGSGASPGGQLTFKAFPPSDPTCAGPAAFSSEVTVAGNGAYSSAPFSPTEVGTFRWTIGYSGDANHAAASVACGTASSAVVKALPTIVGKVGKRLRVGTRFRDAVTLSGGFNPGGTITFQIYGPGASADRCEKPAFTNTIRIKGNGVWHSDPFVAKRAGRYRFLAVYSGDAANQPTSETCAAPEQLARVKKRTPKLRPLVSLTNTQQVSVRARLTGAFAPSGVIAYRLYAPGDRRCTRGPVLSGALRVKRNGTFRLAEYIATKPGQYRLAVGYSGDPRNNRARLSCKGTKPITVGD